MKKELKVLATLVGVFLFFYFVPFGNENVKKGIYGAFDLLQWYVREHTLACVVPAMFIAGAISTFLSQASVMRYLGPNSNRFLAYTVGAVAGVILAVCSCSVLPMFAGIYAMGAGLGPGSAFLYSGPAINVMAIFLSARVLGFDLGVARVIGSVAFAYAIGLLMAFIFRREEKKRIETLMQMPSPPASPRRLWQTGLYFAAMVLFLVFSDWYNTNDVTIAAKGSNGATMTANVQYTMVDAMDVQEYLPSDRLSPEVKQFRKADLKEIWRRKADDVTVSLKEGPRKEAKLCSETAEAIEVQEYLSPEKLAQEVKTLRKADVVTVRRYKANDVTVALEGGWRLTGALCSETADRLEVQQYIASDRLSPEVVHLSNTGILEVRAVPSFTMTIHGIKWYLAGVMGIVVLFMLWRWFGRDEIKDWLVATWDFGKMIVPLLFGGVFVTGFISKLIPKEAVAGLVGDNGVVANFVASFVGMCWYFATLTEIPITQALMKLGMAKGPALALLLAGPALSIPSILVLRKIMGGKKTFVFCALTVIMSTVVGVIFGLFFA
jgi:uncharacterized membrane protein YraQ (UPF0718 family)